MPVPGTTTGGTPGGASAGVPPRACGRGARPPAARLLATSSSHGHRASATPAATPASSDGAPSSRPGSHAGAAPRARAPPPPRARAAARQKKKSGADAAAAAEADDGWDANGFALPPPSAAAAATAAVQVISDEYDLGFDDGWEAAGVLGAGGGGGGDGVEEDGGDGEGDFGWPEDDDDDDGGGPGGDGSPRRKRLPAEMRCFDTARIFVKGGDGGKGCVAFRREKFVPKGGPAGGDGGPGGSVYAVADPALNSLSVFRRQMHFRGVAGAPGSGSNMTGAGGRDVDVRVPPGTIFRRRDAEPGERPVAEVVDPGERALLVAGGRGGRGNASFKSGRNNAPTMAELGEPGAEEWMDVELRLVADVGIVGVPNAGKSTLLSSLSAARPKVAAYPFTTLVPNLGVCELDFESTVFADVPGLLEGAHAGVGLGHEFLRHVSRCRAIVHVVDGSSPDPVGDYAAIRGELALFSPALAAMPQVVAYNKVDLPDSADYFADVAAHLSSTDGVDPADIIAVSAATGTGAVDLVRRVRAKLAALPVSTGPVRATDAVNATAPPKKAAGLGEWSIDWAGATRTWTVSGAGLDRFVAQTNWDYYEAALRFQRVLEAAGIAGSLRARGVREGDTVIVGGAELVWSDDRSEAALFEGWLADRKATGRVAQGSHAWPHAGG